MRLASKPTVLAATLFASFAAQSPARAAYIVTFSEVGPNVVANGSGSINLTGLTLTSSPGINFTQGFIVPFVAEEVTGPAGLLDAVYTGFSGPTSFGSGGGAFADFGSGDLVAEGVFILGPPPVILLSRDYQSGAPLVDSSTYLNANFATLGVTPGTYVYTWSSDSFTVQIGPAVVPAPLIGSGLPGLLAVGGLLLGAKLLERGKRRRPQFG
jgi:hypothetical protein